ncbi:MAG: SIR2 family protein [Coleofasciculaceae cyanobacterium]
MKDQTKFSDTIGCIDKIAIFESKIFHSQYLGLNMINDNSKVSLISLNKNLSEDEIAGYIAERISINDKTALMIGTGFSSLIKNKSGSWLSLLDEVIDVVKEKLDDRFKKKLKIYNEGNGNSNRDPQVEAYILSRQFPKEEGSQANELQKAVTTVIKKEWYYQEQIDNDQQYRDKVKNFCNFLESIDCRIIIDLNYDNCLETVLKSGNIKYTRIVGTEKSIDKLLPVSGLLLWKIHGIAEQEHTIILSPSDYQRLYETNNIGDKLIEIGKYINHIWTVGVGLQDDDIWSHLCVSKNSFTVNSIYTTEEEDKKKIEDKLKSWLRLVKISSNEITIFYGNYKDNKLSSYLETIQTIIKDGKSIDSILINDNLSIESLSKEIQKQASRFDKICDEIYFNNYGKQTRMALLEQFNDDYSSLISMLLAREKHGFSSTWLEPLTNIDIHENKIIPILENIINQVKYLCEELNKKLAINRKSSGLLYYAASQAVISHVLDTAITFGKKPTITFENKNKITNVVSIHKGQPFIVGNNPFKKIGVPDFNTLHFFVTTNPIVVGWPFIGKNKLESEIKYQPNLAGGKILTEDEWEVVIRHIYKQAKPTLKLDKKDKEVNSIDISAIPPIYPCGFLIEDIHEYRKNFGGCVTQKWHLVNTYTSTGLQIVKGGGLRDSRNAYTIGGRGFVAIGEYEPLMTEARQYVRQNKSQQKNRQ